AFAQTLERMLDAVRLNYWAPDAATRRELAQAYTEAVRATGLRERNEAVQRFAQAALVASPVTASAPVVVASPIAPVEATQPAPESPAAADLAQPVAGLQLKPVADTPSPPPPSAVLPRLLAAFGAALLLAIGALVQWRRGRAVPAA
ncbi:MAG TPA: cobaltochelatase subunit CobN, partial [Burkholderiaceae bacterium]|nr:cobaltochelatase subunit CobN [Burkholderiaceae bacterium]